MTRALRGVHPVLSTPFTAAGDVDETALAAEVRWLVGHGVAGVTVAMVSEVLRLGTDERRWLTEALRALVPPGVGLVVSVGAESTKVACALACHAAAAGATAVMAIPPVAVAADDAELFGYFAALLDATHLPVVVQDASAYVGRPMPVELHVRLLEAYGEERVHFKPEAEPLGPRLSALRDATGGRARVFEGSGGVALVDSHHRGVVGTMPGPEVPWALVPLWAALERGDDETAYRISAALAPLLAVQRSLDSYVAVEKFLLREQGVFTSTHVRGPVAYRLDPETEREVVRLMARLRSVVEACTCAREERR
jgi:4-hydroxy-tetrahydrodipicolinate synthase